MRVSEQAAYAGIFGFVLSVLALMLNHVGKQHRLSDLRMAARDKEFVAALDRAYDLLRTQHESRVREVAELMHCTRDGVNGAVVEIQKASERSFAAIRDTNASLIQGFAEVVRKLEPVLAENTSVVAQARMVIQGAMLRNGHG